MKRLDSGRALDYESGALYRVRTTFRLGRKDELMAKAANGSKPATKSQIIGSISTSTGLAKKEVGLVFDELGKQIRRELGKKGPGIFTIPGLVKLKVQRKPATKARKGINPFTKEEIMIKAKPARNVVKAQPLKAVKDMV